MVVRFSLPFLLKIYYLSSLHVLKQSTMQRKALASAYFIQHITMICHFVTLNCLSFYCHKCSGYSLLKVKPRLKS